MCTSQQATITPFCLWKPAKCCLTMKYGEGFIPILRNYVILFTEATQTMPMQ